MVGYVVRLWWYIVAHAAAASLLRVVVFSWVFGLVSSN